MTDIERIEEKVDEVEKLLRKLEIDMVKSSSCNENSLRELRTLQANLETLKKDFYTFREDVKPQAVWIQQRRNDSRKIVVSLIIIILTALGSAGFGLYKVYSVLQVMLKVNQ